MYGHNIERLNYAEWGFAPFQHRALLVVGTPRISLLADRPYGIAFHVFVMCLGWSFDVMHHKTHFPRIHPLPISSDENSLPCRPHMSEKAINTNEFRLFTGTTLGPKNSEYPKTCRTLMVYRCATKRARGDSLTLVLQSPSNQAGKLTE
jgi:hypothetical protein